jgi:PAS domain S-box-containing protein
MTKQADKAKGNKELENEIERLYRLLEEERYQHQEAKETLEAIRTGAVDGIVRSSPEGEQVFILKGSDQPYRNLIEEMSEGALLISEIGTILYANIGFAGLVDAPLDKVIGTHVSDWVSARNVDVLNDIISGNRKNGKRVLEIAFQTTKQKLIPTQVSLSKILFGTVNASALVITDLSKHMEGEIKRYTTELETEITQRKKAEKELDEAQNKLQDYAANLEKLVEERTRQLKDSERLATIGAIAGMVGHDIRNPLQTITGDVYLAKSDLTSMPECEGKQGVLESLIEVEKNIEYINKIVQDLQDFAKPLKPNIEETDLKGIIDDLLQKNGLPKNVEVSIKIETEKIVADSTFINRIMNNLVNNAVQAMPDGGKLTIHTYKQSSDTVIAVKDTGVGIPEAVKEKLFTPMFTTKSKGQGFGLAVIKRMAEALGGTVSFESQEGKGTTFIIRLPPPQELNGKWTYKQH